MPNNENNVVMQDVRLVLRNFSGREGMYNREGDREFSVLLDDDVATAMAKDGWNVKWFKAKEPGEPEQAFLTISVKFKKRPPRIVLITSRGRTTLTEDEVELLDYADIRTVDLIVRPYEWVVNGKTGIKAYLKSLFATIEEDELDIKYASLDDVPARAGRVYE
jgi:hypothetical protein